MKKALITGITGQDGSYLVEFLLDKGYEVWGLIRRSSSFNTGRIDHLYADPHEHPRLRLVYGDMTDGNNLSALIGDIKPDEVYNLAAQSHVRVSFDQPIYTVNAGALGTLRLLEAIRSSGLPIRFTSWSTRLWPMPKTTMAWPLKNCILRTFRPTKGPSAAGAGLGRVGGSSRSGSDRRTSP